MTATAGQVLAALPFTSPARTWGNEVYFEVPVSAAFECAKKEGLKVVASCPFIANNFQGKFSQYQKGVSPREFPFAGKTRAL